MNIRQNRETKICCDNDQVLFWCVWFTEHTSGPEPLGGNSRETMSDGELQRFGGGFSKSSLMILKTSPKPRRTPHCHSLISGTFTFKQIRIDVSENCFNVG